MKIVVIGGTGLIGSQVVAKLTEHGHEAVAASPGTGVNTLTGEGVAEVLGGAEAVIDVSNSPSFADDDVMSFFRTSTGTLIAAAREAGVGHYVALSVVGTQRLTAGGYMRAKVAQEELITASGLPYTIVHATQFFEFARSIAATATEGNTVRLTSALVQPIASADVATAVARAAVGSPLNGMLEIAGPESFGMDEFVRRGLAAFDDPREVLTDDAAPYFGMVLEQRSLLPEADATIFPTTFTAFQAAQAVPAS